MKKLLTLLLITLAAAATEDEPGFKTENIVLYQADKIMSARLKNDVTELSKYVKTLEAVCVDYFASEASPESLHVVMAVKPGKRSRAWFVAPGRADIETLATLREKLEKVPAIEVFGGPVAFAIAGKIAGGSGKVVNEAEGFQVPIPKEWKDAAKNAKAAVEVPDGFLVKVWPDTTTPVPSDVPAPPGFVKQMLEPTGGRIFRPKDWHYAEQHGGPRYMWTISKEAISKDAGYTTGVRIQIFTRVKEHAGQSAQQFIENFAEQKKKSADRLIKTCAAKEMGLFTRICIETEEGPHHILYSLFWGSNDLDLAVVSISGTTKELWTDFSATFDTMSEFELIDMKRFEKAESVK